jgi:Transposase DDE domain
MHPSIIPVLARLRQDINAILKPEAIREACRQAGYSWRDRKLDPVATISLFLLQILHGNTACQHVVQFGRWAFSATAFCKARKRLPLGVLQSLVETVAAKLRSATAENAHWLGHRVWMIDGSGFSMPDVPQLQDHFGSPSGQRPGCGFPVGHLVGLFDLATGLLLRVTISPMRTHDMSQVAHLACELEPGDLVLGDTGFCSYAHLAMLIARGNHAVFRMHQKRIVDFTPGRAMPTRRSSGANLEGLPHSLWVRSNGPLDQVVVWSKPKQKPRWMTAERFAELPTEITVRELRYQVTTSGFRVRVVTLVTTLLDPVIYPKAGLAELYRRRWQIELNLRHIKITMKMDSLHCKTLDGVMKELAMFALAYNLVISVMLESAGGRKLAVGRVSFLDALRWLTNPIPGGNPGDILINPARPDRIEPRVIKRRMKKYPLMKEPRTVLRKRLLENKLTA